MMRLFDRSPNVPDPQHAVETLMLTAAGLLLHKFDADRRGDEEKARKYQHLIDEYAQLLPAEVELADLRIVSPHYDVVRRDDT